MAVRKETHINTAFRMLGYSIIDNYINNIVFLYAIKIPTKFEQL